MKVYDGIMQGLNEAVEYNRNKELIALAREHATYDIPYGTIMLLNDLADALEREETLKKLEEQNLQISQELDDLRKSQEEREKTFNNTVKKYDDREVNIVQNAKNLTGMPPENAVAILNAMEDQDVIDTLRKVEEIAQEEGTMSMVSYWLSLMPADRVAVIQRKMVSKPKTLQ